MDGAEGEQGRVRDLPECLLQRVFARLRVYNLPTCSLVCKQWRALIASEGFPLLHDSLHRDWTWFTLWTRPGRSIMFYDTLADRPIAVNRPYFSAEDVLLATADGLILFLSQEKFIVTNFLTRQSRTLNPPNRCIWKIAFVGMVYHWRTRSYTVLICGGDPVEPGCLFTEVYDSVRGCWSSAESTLMADSFVGWERLASRHSKVDPFAKHRTCVWYGGMFYCILERWLYCFDLAAMAWKMMEVCLPDELTHFQCLVECNGELFVAGNAKDKQVKKDAAGKDQKTMNNVVRIWRLVNQESKENHRGCVNGIRACESELEPREHGMQACGPGMGACGSGVEACIHGMRACGLGVGGCEFVMGACGPGTGASGSGMGSCKHDMGACRHGFRPHMSSIHPSQLAWKYMDQVSTHAIPSDDSLNLPGIFEGSMCYGRGDQLCLSIVDETEFQGYMQNQGPSRPGPEEECQVQFHIYDLVNKRSRKIFDLAVTTTVLHLCIPCNLPLHPCIFTVP